MRTLTLLFLTWLALATACTAFPSPVPNNTPVTSPDGVVPEIEDPDIESTIRAIVAAAVREALAGPTSNADPDSEATIAARVRATIEALLATPALPLSPIPTPQVAPVATKLPGPLNTPAPDLPPASTPEASTLTAPTPQVQPTVAGTATVVLPATPTLSPTATSIPQPTTTPSTDISCQLAADGTVVTAWIEAAQVAATTVTGGSFVLFVEQPEDGSFAGQTISFKIGGLEAEQTATWAFGRGDPLDLTATALPLPAPTPAALGFGPRRYSPSGVLAQPVPPHLFLGTAAICTSP